jgi:hypothetical protein
VRGGDLRSGDDNVSVPSLGARRLRDPDAGGYRVDYIYRSDPDYPDERSPLADPYLQIEEGDVIEAINGVSTLDVPAIGALLRNQGGRQVLMRVRDAGGAATTGAAGPAPGGGKRRNRPEEPPPDAGKNRPRQAHPRHHNRDRDGRGGARSRGLPRRSARRPREACRLAGGRQLGDPCTLEDAVGQARPISGILPIA